MICTTTSVGGCRNVAMAVTTKFDAYVSRRENIISCNGIRICIVHSPYELNLNAVALCGRNAYLASSKTPPLPRNKERTLIEFRF